MTYEIITYNQVLSKNFCLHVMFTAGIYYSFRELQLIRVSCVLRGSFSKVRKLIDIHLSRRLNRQVRVTTTTASQAYKNCRHAIINIFIVYPVCGMEIYP